MKFFRVFLTIALIFGLASCSSIFGSKKKGEGLSEADLNAAREGRFGEGGIPTAEGEGMFRDVRFGYDSYNLDDMAMQSVEFNAEVLKQNSDVRVQLEGHCDERGTAEYNLSLGAQRAKAVRDTLVSLGVPSSRVETISYGEEVPLDQGHDESAWVKNRRVHFSAFSGSPSAGKGTGSGTGGGSSRY